MTRHMVVFDGQVDPDCPIDNWRWFGLAAQEYMPDVIVNIGDLWDMRSLSSYDKGTKTAENYRYVGDIEAGNRAQALFMAGIQEGIDKSRRSRRTVWKPRLILLRGNHEERIMRAVNVDATLEGKLSYADLLSPGWETHEFLVPVKVDGVAYSHLFQQQRSNRPISGAISTMIKTIGCSFTAGHEQIFKFGVEDSVAGRRYGLVCGSSYLQDAEYRGPQSNREWRGICIKDDVKGGTYDPTFLSLGRLCRKYEGVSLGEFLTKKYPKLSLSLKEEP